MDFSIRSLSVKPGFQTRIVVGDYLPAGVAFPAGKAREAAFDEGGAGARASGSAVTESLE